MAVVLLIPWKSRVARAGLRRARLSRWASLLLAALALITLIAGLGYATGLVRSVAGDGWHPRLGLALPPTTRAYEWTRFGEALARSPDLLVLGVSSAGKKADGITRVFSGKR